MVATRRRNISAPATSSRWCCRSASSLPFPLPAFALYRSLRRVNPAPFLCYLDFEDFQIVCSSPEILVRVRDGKVTIRPIAGTRPRGATAAEDRAHADSLLADQKERAEHLMLLDLGRNDVGRVAEMGSVHGDGFVLPRILQPGDAHRLERRRHARRRATTRSTRWSRAFRPARVSGAPKVRAMEIIDELEKDKRGPYAGCIGYFGANGEMDTCIVLRTAVVKDGRMARPGRRRHRLRFRSGLRAAGMHQQGQGAVPRRRGRGALRQPARGSASERSPPMPPLTAAARLRKRRRAMTRVLVIDNYDSFTWNLVHLLGPLVARGRRWCRNDAIDAPTMLLADAPDAIVLSPGPCTPNEAGICLDLVASAPSPQIPIFGVCLGLQAIGQAFGGTVSRAPVPMHGKVSDVEHRGRDGVSRHQRARSRRRATIR